MKLTMGQQYMLSVIHSQKHAFWCSGDFRSLRISRHAIGPTTRRVNIHISAGMLLAPPPEELIFTQILDDHHFIQSEMATMFHFIVRDNQNGMVHTVRTSLIILRMVAVVVIYIVATAARKMFDAVL